MQKKIISVVALISLLLLLCACGSNEETDKIKKVTDQRCGLSITNLGLSYNGLFTGTVDASGSPIGQGKFVSNDGKFSYEGAWEDGSPATGTMYCEELPFTYGDTTYACLYQGGATDCTPDGEGSISYDKKNIKLSYTGLFDKGILADGHFSSNVYTLVLENGKSYTGAFDGEWKDNCAHGYGEFTCPDRNSYGVEYKGEWKYGQMDGQGKLIINETALVQEGNFSKNEFYPNPVEYFRYLQTNSNQLLYEFPGAYDDLSAYSDSFKAGTLPELEINYNFDYNAAQLYPEQYPGRLEQISLRIASSVEMFVQSGEEMTCFHAMDDYGNFYRLYLFGRHDDMKQNDYLQFYVLPVFVSNETMMKNDGINSSKESKTVLWALAMDASTVIAG